MPRPNRRTDRAQTDLRTPVLAELDALRACLREAHAEIATLRRALTEARQDELRCWIRRLSVPLAFPCPPRS